MIQAVAPQTIAIEKLARMVSGSSTLQERAGMDETDIMERIYLPARMLDPWEGELPEFPCCNIEIPEGSGAITFQPVAGGARDQFSIAGSLMLGIWDKDRYPSDYKSSYIDFGNFEGLVITDALQLSSHDNNLVITSVEQVYAPESLDDKTPPNMRFYLSCYLVAWRGVLTWQKA